MISFPALLDRTSGTIVIQQHWVVFNSDDGTAKDISLAISRMKITLGGRNSTHYYLSDPHLPNITICVQDVKIIEILASQGCSSAKQSLQQTKERHFWRTLKFSAPIFSTIFLILLIPIMLSFIPISWLNDTLSFEQEKQLGELLFPSIKKDLLIDENHPSQKKIEDLTKLLQIGTKELSSLKIDVYISKKTDINAFALPGGIIVVNQGLISSAESSEEIVGVLAHELAHIERRHLVKSMAGRLGNLAGVMLLTLFVGTDAIGVVSGINNLVTLKYSREDESEADARGFEFLVNAKVSAEGMINFFTKLSKKESSLEQALLVLSTHPISQERVEKLNILKQQYSIEQPQTLPWTIKDLNF